MKRALGIYREIEHSPDREFDDYEILRKTAEEMVKDGFEVTLKEPPEVFKDRASWEASPPDIVFVMCEQEKMLELLCRWEKMGIMVVNSSEAITNTYRSRTVPVLKGSQVPFPESEIVQTRDGMLQDSVLFKKLQGGVPLWIKRSDVHNTQKGDVTFASRPEEAQKAVKDFFARGISDAVFQLHVPGDLIKFYGVGDPSDPETVWFQWFYHKGQDLKDYAFSRAHLMDAACLAASTLGVEVFGGDAIVTAEGKVFVIDVNAWPSFALFRKDASAVIARYLISKIQKKVQKI